MTHQLICPACSLPLKQSVDKCSRRCDNGHSFDVARQGYLNLLLSQHKKSKQPGDTQEMVQARSTFLNSGFYQGIADFLINQSIQPCLENSSGSFHYCDLACGEGFYTSQIHDFLEAQLSGTNIFSSGIDISNPAIRAACKRNKCIQWIVASLARAPLADQSQNLISGLFFHFDFAEIKRLLKPDGYFVMVTTGSRHLIELRELIYEQLKPEKIKDFSKPNNFLEHRKTLYYTEKKVLTGAESILELLAMTPHFWRCKPEKKQVLRDLPQLELTLDIQVDIFKNTQAVKTA
jgi:23S rRNA (guanine745-N1)-methyltransferase